MHKYSVTVCFSYGTYRAWFYNYEIEARNRVEAVKLIVEKLAVENNIHDFSAVEVQFI